MKTLPFWLGRLASVKDGCGGKNWDHVTPIVGTVNKPDVEILKNDGIMEKARCEKRFV